MERLFRTYAPYVMALLRNGCAGSRGAVVGRGDKAVMQAAMDMACSQVPGRPTALGTLKASVV